MSTRGLIGFRVDGVDKAAYSHSDSYPTCLGVRTLKFFRDADPQKLEQVARKVKCVDDSAKPSIPAMNRLLPFMAIDPAIQADKDRTWHSVLSKAEGKWDLLYKGLPYMLDYAGFIWSRPCEWAYLYDVNTQRLEIYSNSDYARGLGRYNTRDDDGDVGAQLLMDIGLAEIKALNDDDIEQLCALIELHDRATISDRPVSAVAQSILVPTRNVVLESSTLRLENGWIGKLRRLNADLPGEHPMIGLDIRLGQDSWVTLNVVDALSLRKPFGDAANQTILRDMLNAHAYFSPSWTAFQADRGRAFSVIVDGISG